MSKGNATPLLIGTGLLGLIIAAFSSRKVRETSEEILLRLLSPAQFVIKYYRDAKLSEFATNVPALVTLAQAGLESNWGRNAPGFNFFGIKAGSSWKGDTQELKTWECGSTGNAVKDKITDRIIEIFAPGSSQGNSSCNARGFYSYRVYSKFRKYASAKDSFVDHGKFLKENKRYSKAFSTSTPEAFIIEVHKAGYATDPLYASKVIKLMVTTREALSRAGIT